MLFLEDLEDIKQVLSKIPNNFIETYRSDPDRYLRHLISYHKLSYCNYSFCWFWRNYKIGPESRLSQIIISTDN